jgi:ribosomal-protein-alanine N-acetyltransferase
MTLILRYMTLDDIQQVMTVERSAFTSPWTARSYAYEVSESTHSHMVVLEEAQAAAVSVGWRRFLRRLTGERETASTRSTLLAYGGLWHIIDEAHVSTIAVADDHRGRGYGEISLAAMLGKAVALGAEYVVLEVRVSNTVAQNLYKKYGFETTSIKRGYYRDNNEDAYDMRLTLDAASRPALAARVAALMQARGVQDRYTLTPAPRPRPMR